MIGKVIIAGVILFLPLYFSLAKSAGYADQRLEEFHEALFRKEEHAIEETSQQS